MDPSAELPPPPYTEIDPSSSSSTPHEIPSVLRIRRKPVATGSRASSSPAQPGRSVAEGRSVQDADYKRTKTQGFLSPEVPLRPQVPLRTARSANNLFSQCHDSSQQSYFDRPRSSGSSVAGSPAASTPFRASPVATPLSSHTSSSSLRTAYLEKPKQTPDGDTKRPPLSSESSSSSIQTAYREARHFVGGLIPHPTESTKHFTILRHSHGLVFYQGNSTTLAVSIFADAPLPTERTLWLQNKGWSGKTGMRAKALFGRNGSWTNITPSTRVAAEQLNPNDERAWQRDISNFYKKASGKLQSHLVRETAIVRMPDDAGDGYFQLVLCLGEKEKILCPSPVFRLVSASATPHSLKGASLKTLPLELGALAVSAYVQNTAGRVIGPAKVVVQSRVMKYMPSFWVEKAATAAYDQVSRDVSNRAGEDIARAAGAHVDVERGPQEPYPICFTCRSEPALMDQPDKSTPTISLTAVSEAVLQRLDGYYYGWCRVHQKQLNADADDVWYQAVISALPIDISQLSRVKVTQVGQRSISVRFIRDSADEFSLQGTKLEVQVMGFIRPDEVLQRTAVKQGLLAGDEAAAEAAILANVNDMAMALSILDWPAWGPEYSSQRGGGGLGKVRSLVADTSFAAQRHLETTMKKVGVRAPMGNMRDKALVMNGLYVQR